MDIKSAIKFIVEIENLRSKQDLDIWCGYMGRKKLYLYVKRLAPEHWEKIQTPENSIRFYYQQMLTGYKIQRFKCTKV
tara:strand:+ start:253 stop:486 length:234 start_codon:yes stop_codon:yes gene_type:complete